MDYQKLLKIETSQPVSQVLFFDQESTSPIKFDIRTSYLNTQISSKWQLNVSKLDFMEIQGYLHTLDQIFEKPVKKKKLKKRKPQNQKPYTLIQNYENSASAFFTEILETKFSKRVDRISTAIKMGETKISKLASTARCSVTFARKVVEYLNQYERLPTDDRQIRKDDYRQQVKEGWATIDNVFATCPDLNRTINQKSKSGMSLTTTRRYFKKLGYYTSNNVKTIQTIRNEKKRNLENHSNEDKMNFISSLVQNWVDQDITIFCMDQWKAPITQLTNKRWKLRKFKEIETPTRSGDNTIVTSNIICTDQGYCSMCMTMKEWTSKDTIYFLNETLKFYIDKKGLKQFLIIADNASWQKNKIISDTWFNKHILYIPPRCPQLNHIETTFSRARFYWKKRKIVNSIEEEVEQIVQIFKSGNTEKFFNGYSRNYIRTLRKEINKVTNSSLVEPGNHSLENRLNEDVDWKNLDDN